MIDRFAISVQLAGMLLLHNSQISIREIETLPLVNNRQEAQAIAQRLRKAFAPPHNRATEIVLEPGGADVRLRFASIDELKTAPNPNDRPLPPRALPQL